jgi:glycine/D-amino acid oxidase-like deaminating enzyme
MPSRHVLARKTRTDNGGENPIETTIRRRLSTHCSRYPPSTADKFMDLRSGHAFWPIKNGLLASYPPLLYDETCDVVVIGGGITGALVAHGLVNEGVDTVLLDKRDIATGSTAASTALLQYEIDTELADLIPRVGAAGAVRAYQLGMEAIDRVEELVREIGDDCGFERKQSLYLASSKSHVAKLRREFECRRQFGFDVEYLDSKGVSDAFPSSAAGAILSAGDGQIDVFRFTHALLRNSHQKGLRVYDRTAVCAIDRGRARVVLSTDRATTVKAKRVVFATGYESQQYLRQDAGPLHSTFAAVSEPMQPFPEWPGRCLIWETARPYFYARTTDDDRVIIGGGDAPFATDHERVGIIRRKTASLVRQFNAMFAGADFEVAYAWAGTFGETKDGLAYIGRSPERPNDYFALGYGGNGITMSVVARTLIVDDYMGRKNPDAHIFRFGR